MGSYTISKLARLFGLSRSTFLYYDRIGLLSPPGRTSTGYRIYTGQDVRRLDRIRTLRRTSLSIEDIRTILDSEDKPCIHLFEKRLKEIEDEILSLKAKQGLLCAMLKSMAVPGGRQDVDRDMWVEMLRAAGMDEQGMDRWHAEFEHRAPEAHHAFLLSLGIPEDEARRIRDWARKQKPAEEVEGS